MGTPDRDRPQAHIESREEVLGRVQAEQDAIHRRTRSVPSADPSTRAGFTPRLLAVLVAGALVGFLVAFAVAGLVAGLEPAIYFGFGLALVVGVVCALLLTATEDGRIARRVRRSRPGRTGSGTPGPR